MIAKNIFAPYTVRLILQLTKNMTGDRIRLDENWITVNGTPVQVGEYGDLQGEVGDKIMSTNNTNDNGQTENIQSNSTLLEVSDTMGDSNGEYDATGANLDILPMTQKNLDAHWGGKSDHSDEYEGWTKEQYAERATELIRSATNENILGYRAEDGAIVRYDREANDFVKSGKTGIRTMFKPSRGEAYFISKMKDDGGVQND